MKKSKYGPVRVYLNRIISGRADRRYFDCGGTSTI